VRLKRFVSVLAIATATIWACARSSESPTLPSEISKPSSTAVQSSTLTASDISNDDRIWFKTHAVTFTVEGTRVTVVAKNPWDHEIAQGDARDFWLTIFDKNSTPQTHIGKAGSFRLGPKDTGTLTVDVGYDHCYVEAELRLDNGLLENNGGPAAYLFGVGNLEIAGCRKPPRKIPPPECRVVPIEIPDGASTVPSELPACDLCDNIEGYQRTIPLDESQQPFIRVFDEETGQFLCTKRSACAEPTWVSGEPIVTDGEWGECSTNVTASWWGHPPPSCSRTRIVTTVVNETNSCTQETREKSRDTRVESEACECPRKHHN